jgi:hypothetical protein
MEADRESIAKVDSDEEAQDHELLLEKSKSVEQEPEAYLKPEAYDKNICTR